MSKIFRKIAAITAAGVMATSLAVSAGAVECTTHVTFYREVGTAYDVYAGSHTYVSEIRYDQNGNKTEIKSTCYMRAIGKNYEYKCQICGKVTSSGVNNRVTHSSCGQ